LLNAPPKSRESAWEANSAEQKVSAFLFYQDNIALNKVAKADLATEAPSRVQLTLAYSDMIPPDTFFLSIE
jgi:hypothetical protein